MAKSKAPKPAAYMPERLTRAQSKARTREALLAAARRVFTEEGYAGASLDRIAAVAGFTKGAVYAHFPGKEQLFLELFTEVLMGQIAALEEMLEQARHNPGRLAEIVESFVSRFDDAGPAGRRDLPMLAMELQLESRRNAEFAPAFDAVVGRHRRVLEAVISELFHLQGKAPAMPIGQYAGTLIAIAEGVALARAVSPAGTIGPLGLVFRILLGLEPAGKPLPAGVSKTGPARP